MTYWSWWVSAAALAGVAVLHFLVLRRMLAVSGRFTALVDRVRFGKQSEPAMSEAELVAALQAATLDAFGPDALDDGEARTTAKAKAAPAAPAAPAPWVHALFLFALFLGGLLAALGANAHSFTLGLRSAGLSALTGGGASELALLVLGGACVGFGTRMAGGCTSGHGLCGVSRLQPGSLLATVAFFATGVAVSFALGVFQ